MSTPATDLASMPDAVEPSVAVIANPPLALADRCCACGGQAYVRVLILDGDGRPGEILLCGHHFNQHETALAGRASVLGIQDERYRLEP